MEKHYSAGLRTTFLVHFVVALIFGLAYLLIPTQFAGWFKWPIKDVWALRTIGAAILAFGASSWLAYKAGVGWDKVKIVVQAEIVWTILGTLVTLWGLFFAGLPPAAWVSVVIMGGFAAAFCYFYFRK